MQDPGGEQQEGVGDQVQQVDDAQKRWRKAEASGSLADVLLTELDAIVSLAAVPRAQAEDIFRLVDVLEDRREEYVVRLGSVVRTSPAGPGDRHYVRDLQSVDGDDVVARTNARSLSLGPNGKTDLRQIVLVERDTCAAADDQRGILPGLIDAIPDACERSHDRQQKRWNPDQLKEEQPTR